MKRKLAVQRLKQALHHLTVENPATRSAYESKFKTRAVAVERGDDAQDISGIVVGFLADHMVKILDDYGETHFVHLDRVVEDWGRTLNGEILHGE